MAFIAEIGLGGELRMLLRKIEEMSTSQQKEGKVKGKQLRWTTTMSTTALQILADEEKKGNKPSSTFKPSSFARVGKEISEKYEVTCPPDHVENHLKTVKKDWKIIATLKNKSGFGWDDNMKMITADQQVYDEEVAAHPSYGKFLNKKINMYDEMSIVAGKDIATGVYAKSFCNINIDETVDLDGVCPSYDVSTYDDLATSKDTATSEKRLHKKRKCVNDEESDEKRFKQLANMTSAIRDLGAASAKQTQKLFVENLLQEVMSVEGYDQFALSRVFDYLVEHELLATTFIAKTPELRKFWVQNFLAK